MEGDEDIEDTVVMAENGDVLLRVQAKQKRDPYRWEPNDLRSVLEKFAMCGDRGQTEYRFVYAGSEGEAFHRTLLPILLRVRFEGWSAITTEEVDDLERHLGTTATEFVRQDGNRLILEKQDRTVALRDRQLRRLRQLLATVNRSQPSEGIEESIYDAAFRTVALTAEGETRYSRQMTRGEVLSLFSLDAPSESCDELDVRAYIEYLRQSAKAITYAIALNVKSECTTPDVLSFVITVSESKGAGSTLSILEGAGSTLSILEAAKSYPRFALVGDVGCGKTVSLQQVALAYCDQIEVGDETKGIIPVIVDLAGYDGASVLDLATDSIRASGQAVTPRAVEHLLNQGRIALLLDDYDRASRHRLPELLAKLRRWMRSHPSCPVLVATHRIADAYHLGLKAFRVEPLTVAAARRLLLQLPGIDPEEATAILHGLSQESTHLTCSPLTLRMLAFAYMQDPTRVRSAQGLLYKDIVDGVLAQSEERGFVQFERSDKLALLGELARWMQDNELYRLSSHTLGSLLSDWVSADRGQDTLRHLASADLLQLRHEIVQSGLLHTLSTGDLQFTHPSFMAHLAATRLKRQELALIVGHPAWYASLIHWASFHDREESDQLVELLEQHPVLLAEVLCARRNNRTEHRVPSAPQDFFDQYARNFVGFVRQFPILLLDPPWSALQEGRIKLVVAESTEGGFALTWQEANKGQCHVEWVDITELHSRVRNMPACFPQLIWLVPREVVQHYHPLEMVYLWVARSLYDLLVFTTLSREEDGTMLASQQGWHEAVGHVVEIFVLYYHIAGGLPEALRRRLRYTASRGFELVVDVLGHEDPPLLRYGTAAVDYHQGIHISVSETDKSHAEDGRIQRGEVGGWVAEVDGRTVNLDEIRGMVLTQLSVEWARHLAKTSLLSELRALLPGFPPEPW
ncbi:MAG: hypothetical protein JXA14_05860 [Anaerolineae bacterium]|nr:hypothetical protein [Anaerolineae bacterium]